MPYRIGIGYDIHRFVPGRPLILGGVTIPYEKGLLGHSDGDAIVHAVCDAILGALGRQDIGSLYPDTSPETEGINSLSMLDEIARLASATHRIANIDINCICEKPRLGPYREAMVQAIAGAAGIPEPCVSVKFRTHEGIGAIGAGEAVAAQAVVLLESMAERPT